MSTRIELDDLISVDIHELKRLIPPDALSLEVDAEAGPTRLGDPTTIAAAIIITEAVLVSIATFFLRKHRVKSFKEKITIIRPDGSRETKIIEVNLSESTPPDESVIRALKSVISLVDLPKSSLPEGTELDRPNTNSNDT